MSKLKHSWSNSRTNEWSLNSAQSEIRCSSRSLSLHGFHTNVLRDLDQSEAELRSIKMEPYLSETRNNIGHIEQLTLEILFVSKQWIRLDVFRVNVPWFLDYRRYHRNFWELGNCSLLQDNGDKVYFRNWTVFENQAKADDLNFYLLIRKSHTTNHVVFRAIVIVSEIVGEISLSMVLAPVMTSLELWSLRIRFYEFQDSKFYFVQSNPTFEHNSSQCVCHYKFCHTENILNQDNRKIRDEWRI